MKKIFIFSLTKNVTVLLSLFSILHGNMLSRWTNFLTEDGEKEWRQRDDEFEIHSIQQRTIN